MRPGELTERDLLRRPGMRRVLDALKAIEHEPPGLVESASGAGELAGQRGDTVQIPRQQA